MARASRPRNRLGFSRMFMRCIQLSLSVGLAFVLLAGPSSANMLNGYPRTDNTTLAVFGIAVAVFKTAFLTRRFRTPMWSTAILMLVSTFVWLYSLFSIAILFFSDISGLTSLFQLLGLGYGLGILTEWPFVYAAMNRMHDRALLSFRATVVVQTALYAVLLCVFLAVHSNVSVLDDVGGGED